MLPLFSRVVSSPSWKINRVKDRWLRFLFNIVLIGIIVTLSILLYIGRPTWYGGVDYRSVSIDLERDFISPSLLDYEDCCSVLFMESRISDQLTVVLSNLIDNLPYMSPNGHRFEWTFYFYHSANNSEWIRNLPIIQSTLVNSKHYEVVYIQAEDNVKIDHWGMNAVTLTSKFWKQFKKRKILFMQTDVAICKRKRNMQITDFLAYDWIGAPWYNLWTTGNGGVSIRNRDALIECSLEHEATEKYKYVGDPHEDRIFSECIRTKSPGKYLIAPVEIARHFALESVASGDFLAIHVFTKGGTQWNHFALDALSKSYIGEPSKSFIETAMNLCKLCPELHAIAPGKCKDFSILPQDTGHYFFIW